MSMLVLLLAKQALLNSTTTKLTYCFDLLHTVAYLYSVDSLYVSICRLSIHIFYSLVDSILGQRYSRFESSHVSFGEK